MCRLPALSNGKPGLAALTGRTQFGTVVKLLEASPPELSAALAYNCSHQVWVLPGSGRCGHAKASSPSGGLAQIGIVFGLLKPQDHPEVTGGSLTGREILRKRFYILFVARDDDGQLRKIPIPVQYLYVFVVGAAIGFLSLTGIASSYARMLFKVSRYNELRTEKEDLKNRYSKLEQVAKERDIQVASLGSLASEVSALYGLKSEPLVTATSEQFQDADVSSSLDQLFALKSTALSGAATI